MKKAYFEICFNFWIINLHDDVTILDTLSGSSQLAGFSHPLAHLALKCQKRLHGREGVCILQEEIQGYKLVGQREESSLNLKKKLQH